MQEHHFKTLTHKIKKEWEQPIRSQQLELIIATKSS